jgi:PAS domain S-box-containing protein
VEASEQLATVAGIQRYIIESLAEVVFLLDGEGRWAYLNPAWTEATGLPVDQCLGRPLVDYVHEEERPRCAERIGRLLRGEGARSCRFAVRLLTGADGHRWFELFARAGARGPIGTLSDVTDRKRAEAEMLAAAVELEGIFAAFPDSLLRVDGDGRILDYKPGSADSLHLALDAFRGRTLAEALPAPAGPRLHAAMDQARAKGALVVLEDVLPLPQGDEQFEARLLPFPYKEDQQVIGIIRNITDRKRAEQELIRAKEAAEAATRA